MLLSKQHLSMPKENEHTFSITVSRDVTIVVQSYVAERKTNNEQLLPQRFRKQ